MTHLISKYSGWLWFAAFVCALFPINAFQLEFFAGSMVLLFAWGYSSLSRTIEGGWNLPRTGVLVFAGLFWLLAVASVFWSEVKPVSLIALCFFSAMPLTFFVGVMAGRDDFFKKIAYALAIVFALLSAWAVVQFFFLNAYFNGQARHPLGDPSSLGALFSLALFCSLGWVLSARPRCENICAIALSVLLVFGILATAARGPAFALLPGLGLFVILLWPQVKAARKSLMIVLVGAIACYGLMNTGIEKKYDMGKRLFSTVTMQMPDISNNRVEIWSGTVDMIKDRPLLGTGIGTYFLYYPEYRRASDANGASMAHNDPMQYWAELGILGSFLFYAFVISAALRSFDALKVMKEGRVSERIVTASIFAGLAAMVVHSHVSFNLYNLSILMLTGLLLAVWFHVTGRVLAEPSRAIAMPQNVSAGMNRALLALPFVMTVWLLLSILAGEYFVNRARDNLFKEEMFDFAENINHANTASQGLNFRAYMMAVNVPMAILEYNGSMMSDEQKTKLYGQVKSYMDMVIAINPRMAGAYYYLARVQGMVPASAITEGTPAPEDYYKTALKLEPLHLGARMELYKLAKAKGADAKAQLAILEPGVNFVYTVNTVEEYYAVLTTLYLTTGNYVKAKEMMAKAYEFKKRSEYSLTRQNTSLPQAIMGGDEIFKGQP